MPLVTIWSFTLNSQSSLTMFQILPVVRREHHHVTAHAPCCLRQTIGSLKSWVRGIHHRQSATWWVVNRRCRVFNLDWSAVFILSMIKTGSWHTIQGISLCWRSDLTLQGSWSSYQPRSRLNLGGKHGGRTASIWRNSRASKRDVRSLGYVLSYIQWCPVCLIVHLFVSLSCNYFLNIINPNPLGILARNLPESSKILLGTFGNMPLSSKCMVHFRWS